MNTRESVGYWLYRSFGITPNGLSLFRVFASPWVGLLISHIIAFPSLAWSIAVVIFYSIVVATDAIDGPLARLFTKQNIHLSSSVQGAVLDRVSDKVLIVCCLIPFGPSWLIGGIIACESVLAYQALFPPKRTSVAASGIGKVKMVLQSVLIPTMIVSITLNEPWFYNVTTAFLGLTAMFTFLSLLSHFAPMFRKPVL